MVRRHLIFLVVAWLRLVAICKLLIFGVILSEGSFDVLVGLLQKFRHSRRVSLLDHTVLLNEGLELVQIFVWYQQVGAYLFEILT